MLLDECDDQLTGVLDYVATGALEMAQTWEKSSLAQGTSSGRPRSGGSDDRLGLDLEPPPWIDERGHYDHRRGRAA